MAVWSVPLGRVLVVADGVAPDVRDGLTPIARRALGGLALAQANSPAHVTSARVLDGVLGRGRVDGGRRAIYRELVRMARDWELRHPLVDGRGQLGSIDGDGAESADYTALTLTDAGADALDDARFPTLLVNGSFAVECRGASSFPPHNLREVADAVIAVIDDPAIDSDGLARHLPGPDFPTGAVVLAADGLRAAYATGRGAVVVRARAEIVSVHGSPAQAIVVRELPFMTAKGGRSGVLAQIRRVVRGQRRAVRGIRAVEDRSSAEEGLRIVAELEREADPDAVLEQLYACSPLETTLALELVATVAGEARPIGLRDAIGHWVEHRRDLVARHTGLRSEDSVLEIVRGDLLAIAERHGDERRTEIR